MNMLFIKMISFKRKVYNEENSGIPDKIKQLLSNTQDRLNLKDNF